MSGEPSQNVPRFFRELLRRMTAYHERHSVIEDFEETFEEIGRTEGWRKAGRWYRGSVMKSVPACLLSVLKWRWIMSKNYLKTAFRTVRRNRLYTLITVTGLTVGMACALFILVFAHFELGHDRFHGQLENIYQVLVHTDVQNNSTSPTDLGPYLKVNYPEVVEAARYHWLWGETMLQADEQVYYEEGIRLVDPSFLQMFDFTLLEGDRATVLSDPKAIILTETAARKYFGDADPMGKTLLLNREHTLTVTGILEDVVEHSSMQFDMLMPMQFNLENNREWYRDWGNFFVYTFIQCREDTDPDAFMNKISGVIVDQGGQTNAVPHGDENILFRLDPVMALRKFLQPLLAHEGRPPSRWKFPIMPIHQTASAIYPLPFLTHQGSI